MTYLYLAVHCYDGFVPFSKDAYLQNFFLYHLWVEASGFTCCFVLSLLSYAIAWQVVIICLFLCRYDFPWTPTKYIPFYGGAEYHDYHHFVGGQSQSNFASVFTYCDYIYGTDKVINYYA